MTSTKQLTPEQAIAEAKALFTKGDPDGAEGIALAILAKHPKDPQATQVFAAVAERRGQTERAIRILRDSLTGASTDALAQMNLCRLLRMHGKLDEAREAGEAAAKLGTVPEALSDLADAYFALGDTAAAIATAERAVARRPDLIRAHLSLGQALLRSGDYRAGWLEYEWRHQMTQRRFKQAQWNGMALASSRLLVLADASPSECVLFARYLPLLGARVKDVIVGCSTELKPLIEGMPGIGQVYDRWDAIPAFEFQTPITGLPMLFATTTETVPATPYLTAPAEQVSAWRARVGEIAKGRKAVGLSLRQTTPIDALAGEDIALLSLAKSSDPRVVDLSGEIKGFSDLAALIAALDAIVGEESNGIHLAGALGKPGVVLLARGADWVWLDGRERSPWYPTLAPVRGADAVAGALRQALAQ